MATPTQGLWRGWATTLLLLLLTATLSRTFTTTSSIRQPSLCAATALLATPAGKSHSVLPSSSCLSTSVPPVTPTPAHEAVTSAITRTMTVVDVAAAAVAVTAAAAAAAVSTMPIAPDISPPPLPPPPPPSSDSRPRGLTAPRWLRRKAKSRASPRTTASATASAGLTSDRANVSLGLIDFVCLNASRADFSEIVQLRFSVFCSPIAPNRASYRDRAIRNLLTRAAGGAQCLVAKSLTPTGRPGRIVGSLEITTYDFELDGTMLSEGESFYLTEVAVYAEMRRRGIATSLLDSAERMAAERATVNNLFLHVDAKNHAAREAYKKAGFQTVAETPYTRAFAYRLGLLRGALANVHHLLLYRPVRPLDELAVPPRAELDAACLDADNDRTESKELLNAALAKQHHGRA